MPGGASRVTFRFCIVAKETALARVTFILRTGERLDACLEPGTSVMERALEFGVPGILGQCGGGITCCTCLCHVDADPGVLPEQDPDEVELLTYVPEARANSRLTCQIPVSAALDGLEFEVVEPRSLMESDLDG